MDQDDKVILCFGDSLTAGYGFTEDFSYPGLLQDNLDKRGYSYQVLNAGISGETSSGGLNRIERVLKMPVDIFVLELGINDALRGLPLDQLKHNLQEIINIVKRKNPGVKLVIAGMQVPIPIQNDYLKSFMTIYPYLARENKATLIPFFLKDVAGVRAFNLPDGLHPNKEGYKIIAENVLEILLPLLDEPSNSSDYL